MGIKDVQDGTKYTIISERNNDDTNLIKSSFYEGNSMIGELYSLDCKILQFIPQERSFFIKLAKKQKEILNEDKRIKSIETVLEI
ncbi:hypothetical protein M0R72_04490 [Candidatus Pacearchaeota archaeon]|jgi:hypothetical protein|nr:hypothetical protein [Candidatus Pacearchaeota archaeon]